MSNTNVPSLKKELKYYSILLDDFHIRMTDEVYNKIVELYPNDIAIENYIRSYIMRELDKMDEMHFRLRIHH